MSTPRISLCIAPFIETLESRELFSGMASAAFVSPAPSEIFPDRIAEAAIRVSGSTASTRVKLFASTTRGVTSGAALLAESNLIPAGRKTVHLRYSSSSIAAGSYYLVAQLVPAGADSQSVLAVIATPRPTRFVAATVDLSAKFGGMPPGHLFVSHSGDAKTCVSVSISNLGTSPAIGAITAWIYASASSTLDASAVLVGSASIAHARIPASGSRLLNVPLTIKAGTPLGDYTLFARVAGSTSLRETNLANNLARAPFAIVVSGSRQARGHRGHHHEPSSVGVIVIGDDEPDVPIDPTAASPEDAVDSGDDSESSPPTTEPAAPDSPPDGPTTQPGAPTTQPDAPTPQPDDGESSDDGGTADSGDSDAPGKESLSILRPTRKLSPATPFW